MGYPVRRGTREVGPTGATTARGCAFDEVLAGFRRRLGTRDSLARDAAAVGLSVPEFLQAVDEDWAEMGVMLPGHLPRAWRTARQLYTVTHPRRAGG